MSINSSQVLLAHVTNLVLRGKLFILFDSAYGVNCGLSLYKLYYIETSSLFTQCCQGQPRELEEKLKTM